MIARIITQLGFQFENALNVRGRLSIANLFPKSKSRCGIYLLHFSGDTFYIGQTVEVVKRFGQHRKKYDDIERLWFQPVKKENLNEVEQRLIHEAELKGLLLTNKVFISSINGDTDLDLIISPTEQKQWIENNIEISNEGYDLYPSVDAIHRIKYQKNFEKIRQTENYLHIRKILNFYIKKCLPAYKKTELSFWALSCLPATNSNSYPRLFCLNVHGMEVFVAGYERNTGKPFAFLVLTRLFGDQGNEFSRLEEKYKTLEIFESAYRSAGNDQIRFHFSDLNELEKILITESQVIQAIKELNLRLMRKGGTIFSRYHCFDLVKDVLYGD